MKRKSILISIFMVIFICLGCGCRLSVDGMDCRGGGYTILNIFDCLAFGRMCGGEEREDPVPKDELAVETIDYTKPEMCIEQAGAQADLFFKMTALANNLNVTVEICFVQDGVLLAKCERTIGYMSKGDEFVIDTTVYFTHYNPNGGNVYYFLNKFEVNKS